MNRINLRFLNNSTQLDGFSLAQSRIITDEHNRKQVVAAAGSGKTRTVIGLTKYRFESGREKPGRFLILSFSRKACAEIRNRLPIELHSAVEVRTFHSFCYHRLREMHPVMSKSSFTILEEEDRNRFLIKILADHPDVIGGIPFSLLLKSRETFYHYFPELAMKTYRSLHQYKRDNDLVEYDDLIQTLLLSLRQEDSWTDLLKERYDMILVDEFQDTDPQQLEFLLRINPKRLMVVGDDFQAIYSFRGATVQPFLDFKKLFRGTKIYQLSENYRSLNPIVKAGNQIIKNSSKQIKKTVKSIRGKGPNFPVISFGIESNQESMVVPYIKNVMILTRSNFRRSIWIAAGCSEDQVLTIHKSKGLEFPVVFLDVIGGWSGESQLTDEEIRIAYVGLTRAENLFCCLHRISYPQQAMERTVFEWLFEPICKSVDEVKLQKLLNLEAQYRAS